MLNYVKNTTIKGGTYKGKYNVENFFQESKFSGMYFGKYDGTATLTAYFYNCTFDAPRAFYLRGNNSTLYMSHCKQINNTQIININNSAKLYLGVGNNFDKNATDLPSQVITTNESYNK